MIKLRFTADRITEDSATEGLAAESGWINPDYSKKEIFEDQTEPEIFETKEEALERIEEVLGAYTTDNEQDFYGVDNDQDTITGDYYGYAAHIEE